MSGRLDVREAIHEVSKRHAHRQQVVMSATVTSTKPLTIEPFGFGHSLTETNDFDLSAWVALYQSVVGLKDGDRVLVAKEDSWTVFDVISDRDVVKAFRKAGLHG